jgi:hypothetical protein
LYCQQARVFEHLETAIETYTADERKRLYMFLLSYGDQPRLKAFLIRRKRIEGDLECRRTIETLLRHISASEGSLE